MHEQNLIAVLWDLENTSCKKCAYPIQGLVRYLQSHGSIYDRSVFHDFKGTNDPVLEKFEDAGFTPVMVTTRTSNNADRVLMNYARKHFVPKSAINTVVLVSSDGDFTPLVKELKRAGKKVWVVYKNQPSVKLLQAADRCIPWSAITFDNAAGPVPSKPPVGKPAEPKQPKLLQLTLPSTRAVTVA